jgi:prolactin regulatory element-binding protein
VSCQDGVLSDELTKINVGNDAPYRMALHPSGKSMVLGMTMGGLKKVDINVPKNTENTPEKQQIPALTLAGSEFDTKGSKFGAIKGLSFSSDGRFLGLGGEDGNIEIVSWPSLDSRKKWKASEKSIRNLDFSAAHNDGVVVSTDESGACKLWDAASGELVTQLQPPPELPRAAFFRCKTAIDEDGIALYTPVKFKGQGYILRWMQTEDGEIKLENFNSKPVAPSPLCGFEMSRSGRFLAAVTPDGDQLVVSARTLKVVKYRKGAHMTFATAVTFSPDDSAILSTSADASATLTTLTGSGAGSSMIAGIGVMLTLIGILIVLIALVVGMLRRFAEQDPSGAGEVVQGLPVWAQQLILPPTLT